MCPVDRLLAISLRTFSHGLQNPAASQKGVVLDQSLRKASFLSHSALPKRKGHVRSVRLGSSLDKFMHACYGLSLPRKLWVMGYKGFMGYVVDFPASQLGRWDFLWVMGGYGLREVWVIRVSTVSTRVPCARSRRSPARMLHYAS